MTRLLCRLERAVVLLILVCGLLAILCLIPLQLSEGWRARCVSGAIVSVGIVAGWLILGLLALWWGVESAWRHRDLWLPRWRRLAR